MATSDGVELWKCSQNRPLPFSRINTTATSSPTTTQSPSPRLVHILSSPRGVIPWPPDTTQERNGPLVAIVHEKSNQVTIWSATTKECCHVLHFGGDADAQPRAMASNGNVFAVSVGYAVHIFSIVSFKHIRTFISEPGFDWYSPFALGTRLLAVPSHGRKWCDLQHARIEEQKIEEEEEEALNNKQPDAALLSSMSTASWSPIDVALGVEKGVNLGKMGANFVMGSVQALIGHGVDDGAEGTGEDDHTGEGNSTDEIPNTRDAAAIVAAKNVDEDEDDREDSDDDDDDESDDGIRVKRKRPRKKKGKGKGKTKGKGKRKQKEKRHQKEDAAVTSTESDEEQSSDGTEQQSSNTSNTNNTNNTTTNHEPTHRTIMTIGVRPPQKMEQNRKWPRGSIAIFDLKADGYSSSSALRRSSSSSADADAHTSSSVDARGVNQTPVATIAPPTSRGTSQCEVTCVAFSPRGDQLSVAFEDGREVYVYAILHPKLQETSDRASMKRSRTNTKVQLLHRLQRGLTRATILSIQHSASGRHVSVLTERGTTHVYATAPHTLTDQGVAVVREATVHTHVAGMAGVAGGAAMLTMKGTSSSSSSSSPSSLSSQNSSAAIDSNGFRIFSNGHPRASSPELTNEIDAALSTETTMEYLSRLSTESAAVVVGMVSAAVVGETVHAPSNDTNVPGYIQQIKDQQGATRVLTSSALMRVWTSGNTNTNAETPGQEDDTADAAQTNRMLTASLLHENLDTGSLDVLALSHNSFTFVSSIAKETNQELVLEKIKEANWQLNIGTSTPTVVETWQAKYSSKLNTKVNQATLSAANKQNKKTDQVQWLNQMEIKTHVPMRAPMFARPNIRVFQLLREEEGEGQQVVTDLKEDNKEDNKDKDNGHEKEKEKEKKKKKKKKKKNAASVVSVASVTSVVSVATEASLVETTEESGGTPWWWNVGERTQHSVHGIYTTMAESNDYTQVVATAIQSNMFE